MSDTHSIWCAATGCPMHGVMSNGTTGGGQFYCFLHFGCKPGRQHEITNELNRLSWLVKITQLMRVANGDTRAWIDLQADSNKEIRLNQSAHLLRGDHESITAWLARLESVLQAACAIPAQASIDEVV